MNITKSEKITTALAILFLIGLELFCIFGVDKVQNISDSVTAINSNVKYQQINGTNLPKDIITDVLVSPNLDNMEK